MAAYNWVETDFLKAAFKGNVSMLTRLADMASSGYGKELARITDREGRNALHLAASNGETSMCEYLCEALNFNINSRDLKGNTPLIVAIQTQQRDTVVYLIEKGADIALSNHGGFAALHYAATTGHIEIMRLLLSRGVPDLNTAKAYTPLQCACLSGKKEAVKLLLNHDADPNATVERYEYPLMISTRVKSLECMELLLEAGADPNLRSYGITPLIFAACKGDTKIINCLLKAQANPDVVESSQLMTPLELAAFYKHIDAVRTLFPVTSRIPSLSDWSVDGLLKIERAYAGEGLQQFHEMQTHHKRFEIISHTALIAIMYGEKLLLGSDSLGTYVDGSGNVERKKFIKLLDCVFIAFAGVSTLNDTIRPELEGIFKNFDEEMKKSLNMKLVFEGVLTYLETRYDWEDLDEVENPLYGLLIGQIEQDRAIYELKRVGNNIHHRRSEKSIVAGGIGSKSMKDFIALHPLEHFVPSEATTIESDEGLAEFAQKVLEEATIKKSKYCGGKLNIVMVSDGASKDFVYGIDLLTGKYVRKL